MTPATRIFLVAGCAGTLGLTALAYAQIEGRDRGVPPVDSSANYEVGGIAVDTYARTADQARMAGWRLAERRGWKQLWARVHNASEADAPTLSDGQLDSVLAGVAVEDEEIGARRYIAHLAVLFDRARAGGLLGVAGGGVRSVPMLVIPVMWSGGVAQTFEHRTEWQKAWARFRAGASPIDYVRPEGSGVDPLVLNVAQVGRPGRGRWRALLDHYGASDIVMPVVQIERLYPGGPAVGHFVALHGPDAHVLARFDLSAPDGDALPRMLDEGVRRIDAAYADALRSGELHTDMSLVAEPVAAPPAPAEATIEADSAVALPGAASTFLIQAETPDDPALLQVQGALRAIPGVASVATDSVALGGVSVLRVAFNGDPETFRTALASAGYQAEDTGAGLRIRRAAR